MITTVEYLKQAKALIKEKSNFTKRHHMVDVNGESSDWSMISPWEQKPAKFGIHGAINYVRINNKIYNDEWDDEKGYDMYNHLVWKAGKLAREYMRCKGGHLNSSKNWIWDFQSRKCTTHKEVLTFFDVLIAMEKRPNKEYIKELNTCEKCSQLKKEHKRLNFYEE